MSIINHQICLKKISTMNKTSISDENKTDLIQKEGIDVLNFATINYIDKCECGIENGSGIVIPM